MDLCISCDSVYPLFMRRYRIYVYKNNSREPVVNLIEGKDLALRFADQLSAEGKVRVEDDRGKIIYEVPGRNVSGTSLT